MAFGLFSCFELPFLSDLDICVSHRRHRPVLCHWRFSSERHWNHRSCRPCGRTIPLRMGLSVRARSRSSLSRAVCEVLNPCMDPVHKIWSSGTPGNSRALFLQPCLPALFLPSLSCGYRGIRDTMGNHQRNGRCSHAFVPTWIALPHHCPRNGTQAILLQSTLPSRSELVPLQQICSNISSTK